MRRIHDSRLVFVHIPKTAGQAVVKCFGLEHLSSDHSLNSANDQEYMTSDFIRFAVVRDPLQRFISAYKYQCHMKHVNTDKVPLRAMINDKKLDQDINSFVEVILHTGFDLQHDMWFRRQMVWLRSARPQVLLRFEHLAADIEILKSLVPEHFLGLNVVNAAKGRARSEKANIELDQRSLEFVRRFYERDFFFLSYGH